MICQCQEQLIAAGLLPNASREVELDDSWSRSAAVRLRLSAVTGSCQIPQAVVAQPKSASRFFPTEAAFLRILAISGGGLCPGRAGQGGGADGGKYSLDGWIITEYNDL